MKKGDFSVEVTKVEGGSTRVRYSVCFNYAQRCGGNNTLDSRRTELFPLHHNEPQSQRYR